MEVEVYTGLSPAKFNFGLAVMVFPDIKAITEFFANIFHFSYATMDISRAFISALLSPKKTWSLYIRVARPHEFARLFQEYLNAPAFCVQNLGQNLV